MQITVIVYTKYCRPFILTYTSVNHNNNMNDNNKWFDYRNYRPNAKCLAEIPTTDNPYGLEWLTEEQDDEIDEYYPLEEDMGECTNKDALQSVCEQVFVKGRQFYTFYQAYQYIKGVTEPWGMSISQEQDRIFCAFGTPNKEAKESVVPKGKQRMTKKGNKEIDCKWYIRFTKVGKRYNDDGLFITRLYAPVKISSVNLEHVKECEPGKLFQSLATKSAGAYAIHPEAMMEIVRIMKDGYIPNSTLRQWLRRSTGISNYVNISSCDLYNFRKRVILYGMSQRKHLKKHETKKLLKIKKLNKREAQLFENIEGISDICTGVLHQTICDSNTNFILLQYLQNLKKQDESFDYRMSRNSRGQATSVVWITDTMRKCWIRYGDIVFADAQKKVKNNLNWPYIGPCGIDNENRVCIFCESIVLEESHEAYNFVFESLFQMEPRRSRQTIKIIYGDKELSTNILHKLHLQCSLFYDHYHLYHSIWPNHLSEVIFNSVKKELALLLNSKTEDVYHEAWKSIESKLQGRLPDLEYLRIYYETPEHMAFFKIIRIQGSMGKRGTSHAEQNHASIKSRLPEGIIDPAEQIRDLIIREREMQSTKLHDDGMYHVRTVAKDKVNVNKCAHKIRYDAMIVLSEHGMKLFENEYERMNKYETWKGVDEDSFTIYVKHKYSANATLYSFLPDTRCSCNNRVMNDIQCVHELVGHDSFVIEKWGQRHLKECYFIKKIGYGLFPIKKIMLTEQIALKVIYQWNTLMVLKNQMGIIILCVKVWNQ